MNSSFISSQAPYISPTKYNLPAEHVQNCSNQFSEITEQVRRLCDIMSRQYRDYGFTERIVEECKKRGYDLTYLKENTRYLDLSTCDLTELPSELLLLSDSLIFLDLVCNELTDLPDWLTQMEKLQKINLTGNKFTKVPNIFYGEKNTFKKLLMVVMSGNPIDEMPISFEESLLAQPFPRFKKYIDC